MRYVCDRSRLCGASARRAAPRPGHGGARCAAELIAAVKLKPSFPSGAVEQTAAVFAALAVASVPLDTKGLAAQEMLDRISDRMAGCPPGKSLHTVTCLSSPFKKYSDWA